MLAHIRNGQVLRVFADDRGWFVLEDGTKVSPPVAGYVNGADAIVEAVSNTNDTSTGSTPKVKEDTGWTTDGSTATRTLTIRDMNPTELDAYKQANANGEANKVLGDITRRGLNVLFNTINEVRANAGQQTITLQQYVGLLNGPEGDGPITLQQFVNYVKNKL